MRIRTRNLATVTTHAWSWATVVEILNHIVEVCWTFVGNLKFPFEINLKYSSWLNFLRHHEQSATDSKLMRLSSLFDGSVEIRNVIKCSLIIHDFVSVRIWLTFSPPVDVEIKIKHSIEIWALQTERDFYPSLTGLLINHNSTARCGWDRHQNTT